MGRFIYRVQIAGRWFVNFADAPAMLTPSGPLIFRYGQRIGDAAMQSFAGWLAAETDLRNRGCADSLSRALPALFKLEELLAATPVQPLPRDVWLPGTQVMVARSREGSADGLTLAAKGGHNAESHNHNDVGQFVVYADGKPVLIDVGVETYTRKTFSPDRYSIWTMQSQYHNLPTINGVMQQPGREFAAREIRCEADDKSAQLEVEIAPAYPPEAGLESWQRRLTLERGGELVIEDHFTLKEPTDNLFISLITPCAVEIKAGIINLQESGLAQERVSGKAIVYFEADKLGASCEEITITDDGLGRVWGERLRRIVLRILASTSTDTLTLRLSPTK